MGLKQKMRKACKSAPAWAYGPHWPCILRFSLRLEIESNRDKISLDCFPSLRTINMYPMLFMKKRTSSRLANNNSRRIATPNLRVFIQAPCCPDRFSRSGQRSSCFYLGITRTEAFLMASNASYPDVRSMAFSRFIVLSLLIIYEYHVVSVQSRFNLMLVLVA